MRVGCNLTWVDAPGSALVLARESGLPRDSVANASQIVALDRCALIEQAGKLSARKLGLVMTGIDVVLGR